MFVFGRLNVKLLAFFNGGGGLLVGGVGVEFGLFAIVGDAIFTGAVVGTFGSLPCDGGVTPFSAEGSFFSLPPTC